MPDTFDFGVSISDHQAEAYDERFPADIWDVWERRDGVVPRGRATDFWNRWEEDVLNAHRLGCRAFRFSIAWARVEPRPGEFDPAVLDHYRAIVLRLRELDIEPIVTLCHFVWPQHVEERGGLRSDQFAEWFAAYAARVRAALDPHVQYWITFNEPNVLLQGFYKLWFQPDFSFPPGYSLGTPVPDQIEATISVIGHLFEAHAATRHALRSDGGEHNLVSANVLQLGLPPIVQRLIDWNVMRLKEAEDWRDHFWRVTERPTLLGQRFDAIIAAVSPHRHDDVEQLKAGGFEVAYFVTGLSALVKQGSDVHTLHTLNGRPVAFVRGPSWDQLAAVQAQLADSQVEFFDTHDQALALLNADQAAALIADHTVLSGFANLHPEYRVIDERLTLQVYVVAVAAGHPALLQVAQRAMRGLQSEAGWIEISRHYFPSHAERPPPSVPAPARPPQRSELERIRRRDKVIVGMPRADLAWVDPSAALRAGPTSDRIGIEFDLGRALAGTIFGDPSRVEFRRAALPGRPTILTRIRHLIDEWVQAWTMFSTFVSSTWWYLGMHGQLPDYLCPRECVGQLDFVSFDYYFGVSAPTPDQLHRLALTTQRQFDRGPLWAGGLLGALRYYRARFPHLPIVIAENGFAGDPTNPQRGEQIEAHARAVQRAIAEGIDVRAYCVWSITSNREWGLPQAAASDFGLYYVDLDRDANLKRIETPSVEVYRKLIERKGAS